MQYTLEESTKAGLVSPIHASLKILRVKGSQVLCRPTIVTIELLTGKGLGFRSPLSFPVDKHVILGFNFKVFGEDIQLAGHITHCKEDSDSYYYEVALVEEIAVNPEWIPILNRFLSTQRPVFIKLDKSYGSFSELSKIRKAIQHFI